METQKYNGWTNYATWRINLEWFDGDSVNGDANYLREYVEECLEQNCDNETTLSYAMAFLSDVNWHEISNSMETQKVDELIYEFNNMDKDPIIEIDLSDYIEGHEHEYVIYNITADKDGLHTYDGINVEWDLNEDLDFHLSELMELIGSEVTK